MRRRASQRAISAARRRLLAPALVLLAGCGGSDGSERATTTTATAERAPAPAPAPVPRFAIGIDEKNPALLTPGVEAPEPFGRFRDALVALKPTYVRVLVDWSTVQKSPDAPPFFAERKDGCSRGNPPCAPFDGIRATLRAVKALGARPVILIYGTPDWAANEPEGCEREGVTPWARMPSLDAYRGLVRAIVDLVEAEDVDLEYLSPWNEPNTPVFLNPQRARCEKESRALAPARYAQLVRVAAEEIGGMERILLGETAGILSHTHAVGAGELAEKLPRDLVCEAAMWAQHQYVTAPRSHPTRPPSLDAVDLDLNARVIEEVEAGLDSHRCEHQVPIMITETGAGDRPRACQDMAAQLRAWKANPRIRGAWQYTMRDDPIFPTGLSDIPLTRLYPAYRAWLTRGQRC